MSEPELSPEFQEQLIRWIITRVGDLVVPADEGSYEGLLFNLVRLAQGAEPDDYWNNEREQYALLAGLFDKYGIGEDGDYARSVRDGTAV